MKTFLIGVIIGIANVIPGVSGGTMAVSFNVFDRIIGAISQFRTKIKDEWKFLLLLGLGAACGILGLAKLMTFLLDKYPVIMGFFFMGVIVGSVPMIYKRAVLPEFKAVTLIPFVLCAGLIVIMWRINPSSDLSTELTGGFTLNLLLMVVYGAIGAACMIVPGVSGSFVLMFIGAYGKVMGIIAGLNVPMICALGVGCVIGAIGCAKIINRVIYRYGNLTYAGILGLVLASLLVVFPGYSFSSDGILPIAALVIGFAVTFWFNLKEAKEQKSNE